MGAVRIVLDTNVLVSGLAYPASIPGQILGAWRRGSVTLVPSRFILDEMIRVLPRLARVSFTAQELWDLADSFLFLAEVVEPAEIQVEELRDRNDVPILGTLVASGAAYLLTGDKDLLALGEKFPIVTPSEFWKRHGS